MLWLFLSALVFGGVLIVVGLLGHDGDQSSAGHDIADAGLLTVFSLRNFTWAAFAFGGIGMLGVVTRRPAPVSLVSAAVAGLLTFVGVHLLFRLIRRTEADSAPLDAFAIGAPATLVLPFDANGVGVISFQANGQMQELPARRAPEVESLESAHFARCRIGWIENGMAVVEPAGD